MNYYAALQNLKPEDVVTEQLSALTVTAENGASTAAAASAVSTATSSKAAPSSYAAAAKADVLEAADAAAAAASTTRPQPQRRDLIKNALIWVDLEMTGLDLDKDMILEIAVILTDSHLNREIMGPELVIHASDETLAGMNDWCIRQHGRSGLTERCRASTVTVQEAERQVLQFLRQHTDDSTGHHLAGSSVHVDLAFLRHHMPLLAAHLPYRVVDVSTVMELCRRWFPAAFKKAPRKRNAHTALSDIQDSIRQLRYYQQKIFRTHPNALSSS